MRPVIASWLLCGIAVVAVAVLVGRHPVPAQTDPTAAVIQTPAPADWTAAVTQTPAPPDPTATVTQPPAPTDPTGAVIHSIAVVGFHPDLRWPRFPDYQPLVVQLYAPNAFTPLWVNDGKPTDQASQLIGALGAAHDRGLDPADYDAARLATEVNRLQTADAATPDEVGRFDVALTVSLMRFLSDSHRGRVNPATLGYGLDFPPKELDLPRLVRELAQDPRPLEPLAGLDPPLPVYNRLREALQRYRAVAARPDLPPIPNLPKLRPGATDPGVPALRAWLAAYGDLPDGTPPPRHATVYNAALVDAVRRFQRRHGLGHDGVIGNATLRALQTPPSRRVRQIELAMERLRWLPQNFPDRFLLVNIPEFRLRGFQDAEPIPRVDMGVVVGSSAERTETPILFANMEYLIFRPYWLVPPSIAGKEILPKASGNPGYLARQNMEQRSDGRLRQRPGPNNALGLLKFIMPNRFHVYLHDTPSKSLFQRSRRDFSHGCIRVADAPTLAEFVLQDGRGAWDRKRILDTMRRGADNHRVNLPTPVAVYIFYTTVVVEPDGTLEFFDDIYGEDAKLDALLARGYPYPN